MRGSTDPTMARLSDRVARAMNVVSRREFVPDEFREAAEEDRALPIGYGQTISQPSIVGLMTELAGVGPESVVLEIGTGSGYQAAVLAHVVERVFTIEILESLGNRARETLLGLGYGNIRTRIGDGFGGWEAEAPFDAILVTAAAEEVPLPLVEQLGVGGNLIVPIGPENGTQTLRLIKKLPDGDTWMTDLLPVRFVPLRRAS